ncbi:small, acid-soluble spore protein, H family, partial [Heyndrickxia ginsengihumi]
LVLWVHYRTATVHPLDNPDEKQNVSVSSLQER